MTDDTFDVVQFFPDETYERVLERVSDKEAVECAKRLSESLGGRVLGTTRRIIITDRDDCCVFEWKFGEGVVFPTREQCDEAAAAKAAL